MRDRLGMRSGRGWQAADSGCHSCKSWCYSLGCESDDPTQTPPKESMRTPHAVSGLILDNMSSGKRS